jgi:hypothetical protein
MFGTSPDVLGDFGMAPRKRPAPMTGEQLVVKSAKAKATRKARGTVGPKKRLRIKGNVPEQQETASVPGAGSSAPAAPPGGPPHTGGAA